MSRDNTIRLADDSRARIPFAVIGVILLTTSVLTVATLNNRSTPERDVATDELNRRLTLASDSVVSSAAGDAITETGLKPVTKAADSPVGRALQDGEGINNYQDSESDVFSNYVKLRIYKKVDRRLEQATQRKDSANADVKATASLPPISEDGEVTEEDVEAALDRIDVTVGPTDGLEKDEVRVEVSEVQHRVFTSNTGPTSAIRSDNFEKIYETDKSYTVTAETAIFEMHSQTEDYEHMLDNKMEGSLYARQWPFFVAKVVAERYTPESEPFLVPAFFDRMITLIEQEVFLNSANYNFQQAAFGTTDQSYPQMMELGWACLAQEFAGSLMTGGLGIGAGKLAGKIKIRNRKRPGQPRPPRGDGPPAERRRGRLDPTPPPMDPPKQSRFSRASGEMANEIGRKNILEKMAIGLAADIYPSDLTCTMLMHRGAKQTTPTADSDMPSSINFVPESDWQSEAGYLDKYGTYEYDEERAAEAVEEISFDPANSTVGEKGMTDAELQQWYNDGDLVEEREITVDRFANDTYSSMFDKGPIFSDETADNGESMPEIPDREFGDNKYEIDPNFDDAPADEIQREDREREPDDEIVSNGRERVVNQVRKRLIDDIDAYTVSSMQYMTSENVYGKLIRQIEQRSERYIYSDIPDNTRLPERRVYELRNEYLRTIVDSIETMEAERRKATDTIEDKMNQMGNEDTTLNEELVRGQLALEDERNPEAVDEDRAEELSEHANHATGVPPNRWTSEETNRDAYAKGSLGLMSRDPFVDVGTDGLPTEDESDPQVDTPMLFQFGMDSAPEDLDTIKKTEVAHITSDEDISLVPIELYKDYPPEPFPDDFEWPDDFPEEPTLDDDELPPPEKFDESELPDDVPNRSEYDFPEDADFGDDLPDDARMWFIRPVEPEKNIYRIVNAHDPSQSLTGNNPLLQTDSSGDTTEIERVDSISYIQIREPGSEEFDASLSSRAQEYVEDDSKDAFTLTAVDVPQESADPENPIGDARGLLPPKLQEPPEQNFRFDVHASPGYLSAQPITRQASPGIRTASGGITHARNTPFTAASYQVANAFPNPGLPIIPLWGPHPHPIPYPPGVEHYASTNYWNTVAKGEYARFELRAKPQDSTEEGPAEYTYTDDLNGGPEKYVRLAQDVTIEIDGTPRNVGRVEPIDVSAMGHYPFIQQGYFGYEEGNWGLGDYLIPGGYGPAECTPAFPNVGPDIPPAQLMTGPQCLDFFKPGAIGGILMSGPLRMLGGSGKVIFASQDNANLPAQYNKEAARLCKREREGPTAKSPREDEANCPDILYRDRFD